MSSKWASHGEKDEGFIPALQEVHCSGSNAQHCAIDEFRESWGEDMARDLELILVPIDILLVTRIFIMKTTGL